MAVSLSTTVAVSIAVALLAGAACLLVGVVTGTLYSTKRLQFKNSANAQPQPARSVAEAGPTAIPEYEEIDLQGTMRSEIQLMENAAYGQCYATES